MCILTEVSSNEEVLAKWNYGTGVRWVQHAQRVLTLGESDFPGSQISFTEKILDRKEHGLVPFVSD